MDNNIVILLGWLGELLLSSWLLSEGAGYMSERWGGRFVGRTLLSIATTLPEIAIVVAAAKDGSYDVALASALGSNLFMITLGLSIMLVIATTRFSKFPQKFIDVREFKMDKIFLLATAVISAIAFVNGYDVIDGILFMGLFAAYLYLAFREIRKDKAVNKIEQSSDSSEGRLGKHVGRSIVMFAAGTIGIFFGSEPFVHSLEGFSNDLGISVAVLAIIISPIAGEMPEKISMILLARKGGKGVSIAVANVLGSKIANNTLLLAVAVFAAMTYEGFVAKIPNTSILENQMILVTAITILAIIPMFRNRLGLRSGLLLFGLYGFGIGIQFVFS